MTDFKKEITLREIVEGMRKNGYKQNFGALFEYGEAGDIYSACALGQAMMNVVGEPQGMSINQYFDDRYEVPEAAKDIIYSITWLNDNAFLPLDKIANYLGSVFIKRFDEVMLRAKES